MNMRQRLTFCLFLTLITATAIAAQSHNKYGQKLAAAPEKARAMENPYANDETARAAGKKLFARHCVECHGESGQGGEKAPSLQVVATGATPGMLHWFIK